MSWASWCLWELWCKNSMSCLIPRDTFRRKASIQRLLYNVTITFGGGTMRRDESNKARNVIFVLCLNIFLQWVLTWSFLFLRNNFYFHFYFLWALWILWNIALFPKHIQIFHINIRPRVYVVLMDVLFHLGIDRWE